jgi:peptidoglycan/LPS O-acetylase OafA/YrhL
MHRGLQYRPDIEGLRAVAILLVVAAHAHVPGLAGGFIGVDVFFVLSGYLISSLLNQELGTTGRIDFMAFYARRLRRLAPALITVVVTTCLVAAVTVSPADLRTQLASAGTALAWVSNLYFTFAGQGYFDTSSETNLFLHTWSLGVEEQFYLVWPALIWLAGRRRTVALAAVFAVSLVAGVYLSFESPNFAFYMMPTRAWQFALGALLVGRTLPDGLGWAGIAMITASALVFDATTPYPGWAALLPSAGAAFILASSGPLGRILSAHPMQAIGKVSYSWYLWHWPVLLLGHHLLPDSVWRQPALVLASLALSVATYHLIEKPVRSNAEIIHPPRRFVLASAAMLLAASGVAYAWMGRLPAPIGASQQYALPAIYSMGCDSYFHDDKVVPCGFGDKDAKRTAVVMGDSIALQWFPALYEIYSRNGWRLVVITKSGCPMVDAPVYNPRIKRRFTECESWREQAVDLVTEISPSIVIVGSNHWYDLSDEQWRSGTETILARLKEHSAHVVLLASTPRAPFNGPLCLSGGDESACVGPEQPTNRLPIELLQRQAADAAGAEFVDLSDLVCPNAVCSATQGDLPVFRDEQHLTVLFTQAKIGDVERRIRSAMEVRSTPQTQQAH